MVRGFRSFFISFGLAAVALPALAAGRPGGACHEDIAALCPEARGHHEVPECLRDNEENLSEECFTQHQHREACRAEIENLCPEAQSRRERRACLHEVIAELPEDCQPPAGRGGFGRRGERNTR